MFSVVFQPIRELILIGENLFDLIVDFTGFTASSEIPLSWVRTLIEITPSEIPKRFRDLYLVNINAAAQAFLRKLYYLSPGMLVYEMQYPFSLTCLSASVLQTNYGRFLG